MVDYDTFCIDVRAFRCRAARMHTYTHPPRSPLRASPSPNTSDRQLQGHELGLYLQPNEVEAVVLAATNNEPVDHIDYRSWAVIARQAVMSIYSERAPHPSEAERCACQEEKHDAAPALSPFFTSTFSFLPPLPPSSGEWAYIDTLMYGRVWLNKASGVILDRVPLGLMAGIHSPDVLPFPASTAEDDADVGDIDVRHAARGAACGGTVSFFSSFSLFPYFFPPMQAPRSRPPRPLLPASLGGPRHGAQASHLLSTIAPLTQPCPDMPPLLSSLAIRSAASKWS